MLAGDSDKPGHPPSLIAWASTQSDQSFRCPHIETLGPKLPTKHRAKTDQTVRMPRLIFAGRYFGRRSLDDHHSWQIILNFDN